MSNESETSAEMAQEAKVELEKTEGVSREDIEAALDALPEEGEIDGTRSYKWIKRAVNGALEKAADNGLVEVSDEGNSQMEGIPVDYLIEGLLVRIGHDDITNMYKGIIENEEDRETWGTTPEGLSGRDGIVKMLHTRRDKLIRVLERFGDIKREEKEEDRAHWCELAIRLIQGSYRYYEIKRPSSRLDEEGKYSDNHWRTQVEAYFISEDERKTGKQEADYTPLAEKELTRRLEVKLSSPGRPESNDGDSALTPYTPPSPNLVPTGETDETPTPLEPLKPLETTESTTPSAVAPPPEPGPDNTRPTPPIPPEPPTPPTDDGRRLLAEKEAENIIKAMEEEEKNRLIERALDRAGFFGSLLFRKRITEKVAGGGEYRVPENVRQTIQEYTLSKALDRNITASGGEVRRLMEQFGYELDEMGGFRPPHPDSNTSWLGRLLRPNRAKTTGATFLGGMALGHVARNAMAGVLGAVGGGALAGGLFGFLRGKREAAEATTSGESWTRELDAALNSQNEAAIELACHKVERIFTDDNARNEFFRDRTRMEASKILERYREGIRRLSLNRMANQVEEKYPTEQERDNAVAERYAQFCGEMAEGEEQFMHTHGATYENALNQELRIIRVEPPVNELSDIEQRMREQVEIGYNRDTNERRRVRRGIVARSAIRGALIGGIAGGIGWYVGNLLSNLSGGGGEAAGVGTGEKASGVVAGGNETQQQWGLFSNENYMREQGFTVERAAPEFGHILEHQDCPVQVFDGVAYAGTDQGAALREAVLTWQDKLDFGGMDKVHIANLMNFAGDPSIAPGVDAGSYHISLEQVQAVIDHIKGAGDIGILSANEVMAEAGIREVASAIAASPVAEAGQEAAKTMWPGWPLIAGAAGFAGGYGVDNARRRAEIAGTNATAAGPIAPPSGGASGRLAPIAPRPPEPEPQLPPRLTSTEPETPPAPEQGSTENANAANQERITALRNNLRIEGLYETEGLTTAIRQIDITLSRSPFNSNALRINLLSRQITKKMADEKFTDPTLDAVPEQVREQALWETSERLLRTYDELQSLEQGANT